MVKKTDESQLDKVENKENHKEEVSTVLSLMEKDESIVSDIQKEFLQEEIDELAPIKEDDINVAGVYAFDLGSHIEVKVYLRNGYSKEVKFEEVPFAIINSNGETLAYQMFDLREMEEIPSYAARPWKLLFDKENVFVDQIDTKDWQIVFDANVNAKQRVKVRYENLPEELEIEDKIVYDKFLEELPDLNEGEFTISTFSVGMYKEGNILVTLVMRNGNTKAIKVGKVPLTLKDDKGNIVKSNLFELKNLSVGPFRARVCNFVFPTGIELEENVSLNNWTVSFDLQEHSANN